MDRGKKRGIVGYDFFRMLAKGQGYPKDTHDEDIFIFPVNKWLGYYYRWHDKQATWEVQKEGVNYDAMIQEFWREKWKI